MPSVPRVKPAASVSLDLDDKWSYMKTHGDPAWSRYPSYLSVVVPRVLEFLRLRRLRITFFLVGQDAAFSSNRHLLRSLAEAGHEIGNHSFHHEPWLHLYSPDEIEAELVSAEQAIERATGVRPQGFRGPGFSVSEDVIRTLAKRHYLYDASTLPTYLGPLARLYYFFTAKLPAEEKRKRSRLFGKWRDGRRPLRMHRWQVPGCSCLIELPVTTMPLLRTPFHLSYLVYLAGFHPLLAKMYLKLAVGLCRITGLAPSFLLHPLDFAGPEDAPELAFFPGMRLPLPAKLEIAHMALDELERSFRLVPMTEHVQEGAARWERKAGSKAHANPSGGAVPATGKH